MDLLARQTKPDDKSQYFRLMSVQTETSPILLQRYTSAELNIKKSKALSAGYSVLQDAPPA